MAEISKKGKRKDRRGLAIAFVVLGIIGGGLLVERWATVGDYAKPTNEVKPAEKAAVAPKAKETADSPVPPVKMDSFARHFLAAANLLQAKKYAESIEVLEAARKMRPHVPELFVNLGYAHFGLEQYENSVEDFNKALSMKPSLVNAYYGLAESLEKLGDLEGALGAMRTYLHLGAEEDPFRRKAMAAAWEWQEMLNRKRQGKNPELPKDNASALSE